LDIGENYEYDDDELFELWLNSVEKYANDIIIFTNNRANIFEPLYNIKIVNESLEMEDVYIQTPLMISNSKLNTQCKERKYYSLPLFPVEKSKDTTLFFNNIKILRSYISKLCPKQDSISIQSRNIGGNTFNMVILYHKLKDSTCKLYDKNKKRIKITKSCQVGEIFGNGTVLKAIFKYSGIKYSCENYFSTYDITPEIQQIQILGRMGSNFFTENEFIHENYRILKKKYDYTCLSREMIRSTSSITNHFYNINSYIEKEESMDDDRLYIQTPIMRLTFDVKPFTMDSHVINVNLSIDESEKDQVDLIKDLEDCHDIV